MPLHARLAAPAVKALLTDLVATDETDDSLDED
jgi:hypothetical protein